MVTSKHPTRPRMVLALMETFGFTPLTAFVVAGFIVVLAVAAIAWVFLSAPPRQITITSGPPGSSFERFALAYQKELATKGLKVVILPSGGSLENLERLRNPKNNVDLGFVQGGLTEGITPGNLMSLGSVAYQPLWLFHRDGTPMQRLSELAGKRVAVGPAGSGTHALAVTLLHANGITSENATLVEDDAAAAAAELQDGRLDAVFLMGDSAPMQILRTLVRAPGVAMYDWMQADAYSRRYAYLNKMRLPQGSVDFAKNLPRRDISLVGPTVELIARKGLNSAVSDVVIEVAQSVHGRAGLLQKAGEFPAPLAHEYPVSDDAVRYYKTGRSFLARNIHSFWIASLVNPILVAIVPVLLVLIPGLRVLPILYRLRIHLRIYRCYRPLLQLERDASGPLTRERARELLERLDEIERLAGRLKVPASFGDQFYELRGHILFVRKRLKAATLA